VPRLRLDATPVAGASTHAPTLDPGPRPDQTPSRRRGRGAESAGEGPIQVEFAFDQPEAETVPSPQDEIATEPAPRSPADEILPLYVCAPEGHSYHGRDILRAVNDVGMNFGEMNIFQHYGIGDLASDTALFNMANMLEPGSFDLTRIDELETTGLVLFMTLPGSADPLLVFELMLNTAERLVQHLGGEIRDQHHHVMDAAAIDRLRQRAAARR